MDGEGWWLPLWTIGLVKLLAAIAVALAFPAAALAEDARLVTQDVPLGTGTRTLASSRRHCSARMRACEPAVWATLEVLDREDSLEALLEYERLFFEGLRRYVTHLERGRQAA